MSIRIITDSASDIDQNELDNVTVLPMTITFGDTSYLDGVDLTKDEFYKRLENSDEMPATSLVNYHQFSEIYEEIDQAGDEAIVLTISAELSGTYQSAVTAAAEYDNISVIDTRQGAAAQKILVRRCQQLIEEGKTREDIYTQLQIEKKRVVILAVVDTLKYLLKGGRISKSSALVGGIIGIKPIVTLEEGRLIPIGKARGSRKSHLFLNEKIREWGGIDFTMPYAVGYSGTDQSNLLQYMKDNQELLEAAPDMPEIVQIGSTVGTHAGPGAVLVAFFRKNQI